MLFKNKLWSSALILRGSSNSSVWPSGGGSNCVVHWGEIHTDFNTSDRTINKYTTTYRIVLISICAYTNPVAILYINTAPGNITPNKKIQICRDSVPWKVP